MNRPGHNEASTALRHALRAHGLDVERRPRAVPPEGWDARIYDTAQTAPNSWESLRAWAENKVAAWLEELDPCCEGDLVQRTMPVGEAIARGLRPGDEFGARGKRFRVKSITDEEIIAEEVKGPPEDQVT